MSGGFKETITTDPCARYRHASVGPSRGLANRLLLWVQEADPRGVLGRRESEVSTRLRPLPLAPPTFSRGRVCAGHEPATAAVHHKTINHVALRRERSGRVRLPSLSVRKAHWGPGAHRHRKTLTPTKAKQLSLCSRQSCGKARTPPTTHRLRTGNFSPYSPGLSHTYIQRNKALLWESEHRLSAFTKSAFGQADTIVLKDLYVSIGSLTEAAKGSAWNMLSIKAEPRARPSPELDLPALPVTLRLRVATSPQRARPCEAYARRVTSTYRRNLCVMPQPGDVTASGGGGFHPGDSACLGSHLASEKQKAGGVVSAGFGEAFSGKPSAGPPCKPRLRTPWQVQGVKTVWTSSTHRKRGQPPVQTAEMPGQIGQQGLTRLDELVPCGLWHVTCVTPVIHGFIPGTFSSVTPVPESIRPREGAQPDRPEVNIHVNDGAGDEFTGSTSADRRMSCMERERSIKYFPSCAVHTRGYTKACPKQTRKDDCQGSPLV
ncbi:hypothetical protein Bbelb_405300 [Branchiostoma belcheri]|nr:hypothetical protein Bbelb_405300 [Branchiostoma belcheri]